MLGSHFSSVYGPVPAVWSRSQPSALSPPLSLSCTALGLTMSRKRRPARKALLGLSRWNTTVVGEGVSTLTIGLTYSEAAFFSACARSTESLTAAASNAVPSLNFTPLRSVRV